MSTGKDKSIAVTATCTDTDITLHFDKLGSYRIWRKLPSGTSWGGPVWERPIGTKFFDNVMVQSGVAYEYKVEEFNTGAKSYILAGSNIPLVDSRGKLILIVERTHAEALKVELARFVQDLVSEGWEVIRHDVSKNDSPESIKSVIKSEWEKDKSNTKSVLLFGAIPVFHSGFYSYDGHEPVQVAADTYYSEMLGDWSQKPSIIPGKMQLMIGRVDFSNLTNFENWKPVRSEVDLLREYLGRNHAWRTGQRTIAPRGAIRDGFSDRDFSSNGWRNIPQLCRDGIEEIPDGRVFEMTTANDYLIAHFGGGGQLTSMAGTGGSDDFALNNIKVPFVMLLGSAFLGRWQVESNFLRSALASGDDEKGCLCAFGAGAPNVFLHRMALGGTIGESFLLSENNYQIYAPTGNFEPGLYTPSESTGIPSCTARVHQSLHGDPTLGLHPVKPVTNLIGISTGQSLVLSWDALGFPNAADQSYGWRVYRSASVGGPFTLVMETLNPNTVISDHFPGLVYMVRAVKLVETPSGSYFGLSCGVFWTDSQTPPMPPDPTKPMSKATFIKLDLLTQGNWIGIYGKDGGLIASGPKRVPSYASVALESVPYQWTDKSHEARALQVETTDGRIGAAWNHAVGFTVDIGADALPHRLALYFLDWDRSGRMQRVEILDGSTGAVLDSREMDDFGDGEYLIYDFQGSIKLRLTRLTGPNCVLSALFFGPAGAIPTPAVTTRTLEILSAPSPDGPWTSRGAVKVEATGQTEFYKLAIGPNGA